jgi:signal transduction histidine kinase
VKVEGGSPGAAGRGGSRGRASATGALAMPEAGSDRRHEAGQLSDQWSAISHELRTPLNAILGHVGLLLEGVGGPLSAEARACLGDVQAAGQRLARQIDWLLLLAQAEATVPRMDAGIELAGLIRRALQRGGVAARAPGDATFRVRGDAVWLEVMAGAMAELCRGGGAAGASRQAPRLEVVLQPAGEAGELHLLSPRWMAAEAGPLPWRLIEVIAARHGAEVGASEQGLRLKWPGAA